MARSGNTEVEFNEGFFETVLRQPRVERLVDSVAENALTRMQADAPRDPRHTSRASTSSTASPAIGG